MSMTHEQAIRAYLSHADGSLDERPSALMREHLNTCKQCRDLLNIYLRLTDEAGEGESAVFLSEERVKELLAKATRPAAEQRASRRLAGRRMRLGWTVGLLGILLALAFLLVETILGPGSIASALSLPSLRPTPTPLPTPTPEAIRLLGESEPLNLIGRPSSVAIQGEVALIGEQGRLLTVDVSSPDRPVAMGALSLPDETDEPVLDAYVLGNHAYLTNWSGGLHVVDISDPAQPEHVGRWTMAGFSGGQRPLTFEWTAEVLSVRSGYAFVLGYECKEPCQETSHRPWLRALDVSDPGHPQPVSAHMGMSYNSVAAMSGALVYLSEPAIGRGVVVIVDFSVPSAPRQIGEIHLDQNPAAMAVSRGTLYATSQGFVTLIDVSRPTELSSQASVPLPGGWTSPRIVVSGDYIYLHEFGAEQGRSIERLAVIDVSDPTAPRLIATREDAAASRPAWPISGIAVSEGLILRLSRDNSLQALAVRLLEEETVSVVPTLAADAAADFEPLIPSRVPSGYVLEHSTYDVRTRTLTLSYAPRDGSRERLSIAQRLAEEPGYELSNFYPAQHIELIEVGGIPAEFVNGAYVGINQSGFRPFDPTVSNQQLTWAVGGIEIWISANLGREGVIQIAESMR